MKKLSEITRPILNLSELDKKIVERFKDLAGKEINECCCSGCCDCSCDDKCCTCSTELCGEPCCKSYEYGSFNIMYYGEQAVVQKLIGCLKVKDIYDIFSQFTLGRFRSREACDVLANSPLFFNEMSMSPCQSSETASILSNSRNLKESKEFNKYVKDICKRYGVTNPIVLSTMDNETSIFCIKNTGTNGQEGSIKNSFLQMYDMMNKMEEQDEIMHVNCLDVSIDSLDDVYSFVVRINLDRMFILNTIREN